MGSLSLTTVILITFGVVTAFHLFAGYFGREKLRRITKVCLLPLLFCCYLLTAKTILVLVLLAAILGWGGDIFLIWIKKPVLFRFGLGCFLLGHLGYICSMLHFIETIHVTALIISILIALPAGIGAFVFIKPQNPMRFPTFCYIIVILSMSICAFQLLLFRLDPQSIIIFAGSIFFLISDTILGYSTFQSASKHSNFYIMLPYILAQTCILLGLAAC